MGTLCNLNLVIFKCFYYQSEKIVAGDINSLNLLVGNACIAFACISWHRQIKKMANILVNLSNVPAV